MTGPSHCLLLGAAALLTACSAPAPPGSPEVARAIDLREQADHAARSQPLEALGEYLHAARLAWTRIERNPSDQEAVEVYNESVAKAAVILFEAGPDWDRVVAVPGGGATRQLATRRGGEGRIDPAYLDELFFPDEVDLPADFERFTQDGIGGALCGRRSGTSHDDPFIPDPGMIFSLTAVIRFPTPDRAVLELYDHHQRDEATLNGRRYPLAADYSAPVAVWLDHIPKKDIGWRGMVRPEAYLPNMGLYMTEPFDRDKVPVILVHGLKSRPRVWARAANILLADPVIRRHCQFLYFQYPTGFPIAYNAAGLRHELQRFQQEFDPDRSIPNMRRMVLIGHSMGGILSNVQVRAGGEPIRSKVFRRPLEEIRMDEEAKAVIRELTDFEANTDVSRVIFVATPHRGSQIAASNVGELGVRLIRFPIKVVTGVADLDASELTDDARQLLDRGATSIGDLRPNSRTLTTILELEHHEGVTFHSIIGDRGRGDTPDSSDGVVPYWSSSLDFAASEKIVPTDHGAPRHDETIAEVRRILHHHLKTR